MITVVVPVYNMGRYLPKAIHALLNQTCQDMEIIIVDDGSREEDALECDRQAEGHGNIRVIHKPNGGLSSARNCGMKQAQGEYIIFPDPDDWAEPDYLEKLLAGYQGADVDLSICGHYVTRNGRDRIWDPEADQRIYDKEQALDVLMRPDSFCGYAWNKLYRMDLIRAHDLQFDEELGMIQDLHFAVRYFMVCRRILYDPVPLYHYSRDNGGVTLFQKKLGKRELSGLRAYEKIAETTGKVYPKVAAAAYASLCERTLRYVGVYVRTGMEDRRILKMLRGKFRRYRWYFYTSEQFTFRHKCAATIAACSPILYYEVVRRFGHMRASEVRKREEMD